MNLTIANTTINAWKRVNRQYVTAICGVALALSFAIAVGGWRSNSTRTTIPPGYVPAVASQPAETPKFVYYLVGSQAEAAILEAAAAENLQRMASEYEPPTNLTTQVVVLSTPERDSVFASVVQEMLEFGTLFEVIDLRGH